LKRILVPVFFLLFSCVTGNDVDIDSNITINIDLCELIDSIQEEPQDYKTDSDLYSEWSSCNYNSQCATDLCICNTCIDILHIIQYGEQ